VPEERVLRQPGSRGDVGDGRGVVTISANSSSAARASALELGVPAERVSTIAARDPSLTARAVGGTDAAPGALEHSDPPPPRQGRHHAAGGFVRLAEPWAAQRSGLSHRQARMAGWQNPGSA